MVCRNFIICSINVYSLQKLVAYSATVTFLHILFMLTCDCLLSFYRFSNAQVLSFFSKVIGDECPALLACQFSSWFHVNKIIQVKPNQGSHCFRLPHDRIVCPPGQRCNHLLLHSVIQIVAVHGIHWMLKWILQPSLPPFFILLLFGSFIGLKNQWRFFRLSRHS